MIFEHSAADMVLLGFHVVVHLTLMFFLGRKALKDIDNSQTRNMDLGFLVVLWMTFIGGFFMDFRSGLSVLLLVHATLHATLALLYIRGVLWGEHPWRRALSATACTILAVSALGGLEATLSGSRNAFFWPLLLGRIGGTLWAFSILTHNWSYVRRPLFKDTFLEFLLPTTER